MKRLERIHRSFLLKETFISILINAILSGVIAFFMFRSQSTITLWGKNGLFFDLIPTIFIMTFLMTIAMTPVTRVRILKGKAPVAPWHRSEHPIYRFFPGAFVIRAFVFAVVALLLLLPITTAWVYFLTKFPLTLSEMVLFKSCYGAIVGLLFTPVILIVAMADKAVNKDT
jgi:hypothetical protein